MKTKKKIGSNSRRKFYSIKSLDENSVNKNPYLQFVNWFKETIDLHISDSNAMFIATADKNGIPTIRTVLLKGIYNDGFVFFTNYKSKKSSDLQENKNVAILFFWKEVERQVRIIGKIKKITRLESDAYFHSRPRDSQIAASISEQSRPIPCRNFLEDKFAAFRLCYDGLEIPLPKDWGGYKIIPTQFEFWQGRENRLHDRILYSKRGKDWILSRLAP
jgi:pyridoxamine 5'-phosphate oxidase